METRHRLEKGCELIALARVEELGKSIEGVGRELLEIVGVHDVSSLRTGCPRFLHDQRNPAACLEDTTRGDLKLPHTSPGVTAIVAGAKRSGRWLRTSYQCRFMNLVREDFRGHIGDTSAGLPRRRQAPHRRRSLWGCDGP